MMISLFVLVPVALGLAGWVLGRIHAGYSRWITLAANAFNLCLAGLLWGAAAGAWNIPSVNSGGGTQWLAELHLPWIP
jgi:hypothetical protein